MHNMNRKNNFRILFKSYYPLLCQRANSYLHDADASEDIVQSTYVRMWELNKVFDSEQEALQYLLTSVKNNCISALRKSNIKNRHNNGDSILTVAADSSFNATEGIINRERAATISQIMSMLPNKCRIILKMSRIDGMTYKEIAQKTGLSVKTIENHMARAIRILREFSQNQNKI